MSRNQKNVVLVLLLFTLVASGQSQSSHTIKFPCLKYLDALPAQDARILPKYLRQQIEKIANSVEFFTRPIKSAVEMCKYLPRKVSAVFISMFNIDFTTEEIQRVLFTMNDTSNRTMRLKKMAQFHLLSSKLLIEEIVKIRKVFCKAQHKPYSASTMSCVENQQGVNNKIANNSDQKLRQMNHKLQIIKTAGLVGNSVSMVFLFIMLAIYLKCKNIRSKLPTRSIYCLSVTQLFLHVLRITSIDGLQKSEVCTSVAILSHWLSLSAFIWLFFILFENHVALYSKPFWNREKRFTVYLWIVYGLPAIIVSVCVLLNFSTSWLVGYGRDNFCFISHTASNLVAFILPVLLVFILNIANSIMAHNRRKTLLKRAANQFTVSGKDAQKPSFLLSLMTLILSAEIIIARTFELTPNLDTVVRKSASFVLSLQGVFLFVAFVCNRIIFTAIKSQYNKEVDEDYRLTYKYNSTRKRRAPKDDSGVYNF
eukprot:gene7273-8084_t